MLGDQWISLRRRLAITNRKQADQCSAAGEHVSDLFASLCIGGRFVNPFETWRDKTLWDFVRWIVTRSGGNGIPRDRSLLEHDLPVVRPHFALLDALSRPENARGTTSPDDQEARVDMAGVDPARTISATWLGQSTCFVQVEGLNVLTDPIFQRRTVFSWLGPERLRPVPCRLDELPHPDVVLVSHNHFDHLDAQVVRELGNSVTWYVPLGLRDWFARRGIYKVRELDWWQAVDHTVGGRTYRITATPTQHWSGRNGLDSNCSLWAGFVVQGSVSSIFHCGDTGYCPAFKEIGRRFGSITLAILPIGSYAPRWYMCHQHIDPDDAVRIHQDIGAVSSIGVHWGTFMMSDEHYLAPPKDLAAACAKYGLADGAFVAPQFGKTQLYHPRTEQ
ncbi:hypothetical protein IWQ56_003843 [Coemansia nantahalensis]|nr:hypothetical protein IWQ56_003843 [Coemansia nantahalensis]